MLSDNDVRQVHNVKKKKVPTIGVQNLLCT